MGNIDEQRGWLRSHFPVTVTSEEGKLCIGHLPRTTEGVLAGRICSPLLLSWKR